MPTQEPSRVFIARALIRWKIDTDCFSPVWHINARSKQKAMPVGSVQMSGKRPGKQPCQRFNIVYGRISGVTSLLPCPVSCLVAKNCTFSPTLQAQQRYERRYTLTTFCCHPKAWLLLSLLPQQKEVDQAKGVGHPVPGQQMPVVYPIVNYRLPGYIICIPALRIRSPYCQYST